MKTAIPASWHSGAAGVRVFGQLSEYAHLLRTDDATDLDNPEAVFEVVKRAAKNTKSVARSVQELEQLEARAASTMGYRAREFDRTDLTLVRAETSRLLLLMAEPKAAVIDIPKRPSVAVAMAKSLAIADRWVFDLYQKKMKATPARFISMVRGLLPDAVWDSTSL